MLEKKSFTGGMNKDVEDRLIPSTDWKDAWNIRAVATDDGNLGAIENCKGNKFITGVGADLADDVLVIGTYEDKDNKRVYYFVYVKDQYNDLQHSILQYNIESNTTTNIAFGCPVLNFQKDHLITGIVVIDDKYLLWTDDYNEPGFIDLEKARAATYGTQTTLQEIRLIPYAPVDPITYTYESDTNFKKNNLRGKLWQFKFRFVYSDGRKSAFSVISKITYPNDFSDSGGFEYNYNNIQPTLNNTISLQVPITSISNITKIEIAARDSNLSDFFIVKTLFTENSGYDNFDISDGFIGLYNLKFRNEEPGKSIPTNESNAIFSYVPLKAKALDIVNNNRIVLANIEEGFDNIDLGTESGASLVKTNVKPNQVLLGGSITNMGIYKENNSDYNDLGFRFHGIYINPLVYPGQTYTITLTPASGSPITYSYLVAVTDQVLDVNNYFVSQINASFRDNNNFNGLPLFPPRCVTASNQFTVWGALGIVYQTIQGINISSSTTITTGSPLGTWLIINQIGNEDENRIISVSCSISGVGNALIDRTVFPSLKTNAHHKYGIVYYDEAGRACTTQTNDNFLVYTPPFSNSYSGQNKAIISLGHLAPEWAKKYQIVYSGSMGYLNDPAEGRGFIQFIIDKDSVQLDSVASGQRTWLVSMDSTLWFSYEYNQNPLVYTWKKGDKLRVVKNQAGTWDSSNSREFNILDYDSSQLELTIECPIGFEPIEGELCEVFTPTNNISADLFYETGYVFDIIDRRHQCNVVNQGVFQNGQLEAITGDVFIRRRTMPLVDPTTGGTTAQTELVEDSHYSDFYRSNSYNKGRPNIFNLDERNIRREASARYSELYIPDTNINGVGTFFDTSFSDYDKVYGNIQKIRNKGKYLVVFQQVKTGRVRVNESILSDMSNFEAVQKSNQVLSDIDYYAEDTGIGNNPESFAESGNSMYFIDAYKGAVNRLSLDGINKVSNYRVRTFFNKELPKFISKNVWGVYDERFDSYIVSFPAIGDYIGYSISFHEPSNRWTSFYNFASEASVTCGVNFITFKRGVGYLHNQTGVPYCNFYGVQYPSSVQIAFNENPSNIKVFKNLEVESNDIWTADISNQRGQASNLIDADYEKIENVYWASLWKDTNSPGGLVDGDDLRSPELIIKLSNDSTNFVKLFTVGLKYFNSESTNR
jgi:hypothetical protein